MCFELFCCIVILLLNKIRRIRKYVKTNYMDIQPNIYTDKYFELEQKNKLIKLHLIYTLGISCFITIIFLTIDLHDANRFGEQISFASTISSIILSIIAIFMSIENESKSEHLRREFEKSSEKLSNSVNDVKDAAKLIKDNIPIIKGYQEQMKQIFESTKKVKEEMAKVKESVHRQEEYLMSSQNEKVVKPSHDEWENADINK